MFQLYVISRLKKRGKNRALLIYGQCRLCLNCAFQVCFLGFPQRLSISMSASQLFSTDVLLQLRSCLLTFEFVMFYNWISHSPHDGTCCLFDSALRKLVSVLFIHPLYVYPVCFCCSKHSENFFRSQSAPFLSPNHPGSTGFSLSLSHLRTESWVLIFPHVSNCCVFNSL